MGISMYLMWWHKCNNRLNCFIISGRDIGQILFFKMKLEKLATTPLNEEEDYQNFLNIVYDQPNSDYKQIDRKDVV